MRGDGVPGGSLDSSGWNILLSLGNSNKSHMVSIPAYGHKQLRLKEVIIIQGVQDL